MEWGKNKFVRDVSNNKLHLFRKTALLQRFAQDYFATDYVATIGVGKNFREKFLLLFSKISILDFQIRTIDIDEKRCKLQVWDTAGQDRFKCVVSSFYRGAHGVMICFDITDLESFRNVENWLEEVKRYCAVDTPIFLVGTKADLQSRRMVTYSMIKTFADSKQLAYIETSSKSNENIARCFEDFSRTLVQHTNQMELEHKTRQQETTGLNLKKNKTVETGGCLGGNSCVI